MHSKEKIQRAGLIGLTVTINVLAACSDRGPTESDKIEALSSDHARNLVLDNHLTPVPFKSLSLPVPIRSSNSDGINTTDNISVSKISQPTTTKENDFTNGQLLNQPETENIDEYVVHWDNFDFGHNLETVESLNDIIVKYSRENQLPPDVVAGIIFAESNGYDDGNEKTGIGKMGVMPQGPDFPNRPTSKELLQDEVNISWGTSILEIILHNDDPETGGQEDMFRAVALYNAGHVDNLLLPTHGWRYSKKVFTSIGMTEDFDDYLERNNIQLED